MSLILPLFLDGRVVLGPGTSPLSADVVVQIHKQVHIDGGLYPPSILEQMCKLPSGLETLSQLDFIIFAGSPLSRSTGEMLASRTKLHNAIGSTEMGVCANLLIESANWDYFRFHPYLGYQMERHEGSDVYELVIHRDPVLHNFQSIFHLYPQSNSFRTKDLFIPHPTKADLWKYQGRVDDLIIFSHGEDLNPIEMEDTIAQHPEIAAVVIGGKGRATPFAIVERVNQTSTGEKDFETMLDQIWPSFVEANEKCSQYVRIQKSYIIFTIPKKPLQRTPKGTINRQKSFSEYQSEIDALYESQL